MACATSCPNRSTVRKNCKNPILRTPSPLLQYRELAGNGAFIADPQQEVVVSALDHLWHALQRQRNPGLLDRVRRNRPEYIHGLYIWGTVGRGKTWLMDLFFEHLPVKRKQRVHFHRFMQRIHQSLADQGNVRDPLPRIAADWARDCSVLCLDEFFVSDIADAMLLGGLFENLFQQGVTLVTTSNIAPDDLYRNGLQRAKFLPAIELIKQNTRVLELSGSTDYRLRILEQSEIFHFPLDTAADQVMTESFNRMAAECELDHDLQINGRDFHARRRGDGIIWFEFEELCIQPRGSIDFIEIARTFNTVMLSNMPQLAEADSNATRRFITLVDEFYDRNVKLLISADAPIKELYDGKMLGFEFQRTVSRLTEMQSHEYLARPHLP
jgi:cell division protein ZapE